MIFISPHAHFIQVPINDHCFQEASLGPEIRKYHLKWQLHTCNFCKPVLFFFKELSLLHTKISSLLFTVLGSVN